MRLSTPSPTAVVASPDDSPLDALESAWRTARSDLLGEQNMQGHWTGQLSSSPLSTATAISALTIAEQHADSLSRFTKCKPGQQLNPADDDATDRWNAAYQTDLSELICSSVRWLADQQNSDGGWGDTDRSESNLATTMLVLSAFRMTGVPAKFADLEPRAEQYIKAQGGVAGLKRRYGGDKTFAVPILTNCALSGVVPWKQVPTLPFELAAAPRSWFRLLRMPVVSYALPALVTIGLAKHYHRPSKNPIARWIRNAVTEKCLRLVTNMQPDSGGFLEATPLTSFVVMAMASTGRADHPIVRRGVEFLLASVRSDGSWPIDTNLATWNTTLAINALEKGVASSESHGSLSSSVEPTASTRVPQASHNPSPLKTLDWLLACQHTQRHPFTDAEPGGWGWTDLSGGVPDTDDTSGALLALHHYWTRSIETGEANKPRIARAVGDGVEWLLAIQNSDGGWPTFCRGWGTLPFDRSATDLTSHALRALSKWRTTRDWLDASHRTARADVDQRIDAAIVQGLRYLAEEQAEDGSWTPLWFGNERRPGEGNPVFGTARALQALADLRDAGTAGVDSSTMDRGLEWLVRQQHLGGGFGICPYGVSSKSAAAEAAALCSVEETAVATEALVRYASSDSRAFRGAQAGVDWLIKAIHQGELAQPSAIGLYFAKLWYYERLYPKSFTVSALGAAIELRDRRKTPEGGLSVALGRGSGDDGKPGGETTVSDGARQATVVR